MNVRQLSKPVLAWLFIGGSLASMAFTVKSGSTPPAPAAARAMGDRTVGGPSIISMNPPSGPVGTQVTIQGYNLTDVTKVLFSPDKAAPFSVVSDFELTATVPTGAALGPVQLITPNGIVKSANSFKVVQP